MINCKLWPKLALVVALSLMLASCRGAGPAGSWAGLTVKDGVAYLAATDKVIAIDTSNGEERWRFKVEVIRPGLLGSNTRVIPVHAMPVAYGELVFVGSDGQPRDEGRVHALDTDSGQRHWQYPPETESPLGNIFAGLVAQDDTVYFASTNQVYALKADTGEWLWNVPVGGRVWGTPLLAEGRLYVSTLDHKLFALDVAQQGKIVWVFEEAKGAIASAPVLSDGTLYVGSFDGYVYALDGQTGQKQWSYNVHNWVWDGLAVVSDTIYVGDLGGYVQALVVEDGQPRSHWPQPVKVDGAVRAKLLYASASDGRDEVLIVVSDKGNAYALDPGDGSVRWAANAPSARLLTSPVLEGSTLVLASLDGPVQVYGVDIAVLPDVYLQQEVKAGQRAPVALYQENQVNIEVVRWHVLSARGE